MNEADVTPDELVALQALSVAASQLLAAARAAGNLQTEAIAACTVTSLGLINTPAGQPRGKYLKRVAEIIFELAVAASEAPAPEDASLTHSFPRPRPRPRKRSRPTPPRR